MDEYQIRLGTDGEQYALCPKCGYRQHLREAHEAARATFLEVRKRHEALLGDEQLIDKGHKRTIEMEDGPHFVYKYETESIAVDYRFRLSPISGPVKSPPKR